MRVFLPNLLLVAALAFSALSSPAYAQWRAGIEVGADRFWGGTLETVGDHRSFRPYRPTTVGISIERHGKRLGLGLKLHYSQSALALEGTDAVVAVGGVFETISVMPEASFRITGVGMENQLRLHAGPLVEMWSVIDEDTRVRVGAQAALSFDVPLGSRFSASILGGAALVSSPFKEEDLDVSFERRTLWRRRFAVGLAYDL